MKELMCHNHAGVYVCWMQIADVWSCGVMLYIMLAAAYPFGRPEDENLKPSRKMHVMLQVPARFSLRCLYPALALPHPVLPCPALALPLPCPVLPYPALPTAALAC